MFVGHFVRVYADACTYDCLNYEQIMISKQNISLWITCVHFVMFKMNTNIHDTICDKILRRYINYRFSIEVMQLKIIIRRLLFVSTSDRAFYTKCKTMVLLPDVSFRKAHWQLYIKGRKLKLWSILFFCTQFRNFINYYRFMRLI